MSTNDQTKPSLADRGAPGTSKRPEAVTDNRSMGELVVDVSEKTSYLIREEIELAKAEVTEKVTKLVKGSVVGIVAGVFILMSLAMFMHGVAWLLNELFFEDDVWIGFMVEGLFWLLVAGAAGFFAYRQFQAGAPPTPELAIEEAKRVKETFDSEPEGTFGGAQAPPTATTPATPRTPAAGGKS
jgi:Putative Actinobacterial Holin-X, holin superfamily III